MAVTSVTLETEVETLVAAIGTSDWQAARRSAVKIRAYLIALPDYGIAGRSARYGRDVVQKLLSDLDQIARDSSGSRAAVITLAGLRK